MTAPEDVNVDDLRRRARRRLVGAIVLALAAAVFVPMLLESDPKPLGEDVVVKIPPVDDGKFVNRLNEKAKPDPVKSAPAKAEPRVEAAKPEVAKVEPPKSEAPSEPAKAEAPKADAPKVEAPPPEPAKAATEEPKSAPPSPPKVASAAPAAAPPAANTGDAAKFSVQLGAFTDDKGANSLTNKLKARGYPAYVEPTAVNGATWWRVRVGPYPTREAAGTSRNKLKNDGYDGIVTAAK